MSTELRHDDLVPRSRRSRLWALERALRHIGLSNRYRGASTSTTIDFKASYNSPGQVKIYGVRTPEDVARMSEKELKEAKIYFAKACAACEFRNNPECCQGQRDEARIFKVLLEDAKARNRFSSRLDNDEVEQGFKATTCSRLLQSKRIKIAEWVIW